MADVAVIGLVQFIDFGTKVVARLKEFDTDNKELPKTFRNLKLRLPLIISVLEETQKVAKASGISKKEEDSLEPLVNGCSV
jgi:hypothetical protein